MPAGVTSLTGDCAVAHACTAGGCVGPFARMNVDYLVAGGGRISWLLSPFFAGSNVGPYSYQLQAGRTANPDADDWVNVGSAAADVWYLIDDQKRVYGKTQWTHYRVRLTTADDQVYYSAPINASGGQDAKDWRLAQEIVRKEKLRLSLAGQEGYLLKRKLYGTPCTECLDEQTGEIRNPDCETCLGTGFVDGYFAPMSCVYADFNPTSRREKLEDSLNRGTENNIVASARMLAVPQLDTNDIWISRKSDLRWVVQTIQTAAMQRGVPLICQVELRQLPFTDLIYDIEIPGQVLDA